MPTEDNNRADSGLKAEGLLASLQLPEEILKRLAELPPERLQEVMATAISEGNIEGGEILASALKKDMQPALKSARAERARFERRLRKRWRQALDLYEAVLLAAYEAGPYVDNRYGTKAAARNDMTYQALKLLHGRACTTASEIRALLASGHPVGANGRARTLHELAVVAVLIKGKGQELAERFLLHEHVQVFKDARIYQENALAHPSTVQPFDSGEMSELQRNCEALVKRYGKQFAGEWGWAASLFGSKESPNFAKLEQAVGLAWHRPFFRHASHGIHAGSKSAWSGILGEGARRVMLAGATNVGLSEAGQASLVSLYQVTTCLLTHVAPESGDYLCLVIPRAIGGLVHDARLAFEEVENTLAEDEAKVIAALKRETGEI